MVPSLSQSVPEPNGCLIRRVCQYIWKHCVIYVILLHRKWCHISIIISDIQDTLQIVIDLYVYFAFVSSVLCW